MRFAGLPMYDLPEVRAATDGFWHAVRSVLQAEGVAELPAALTRDADIYAHWRDRRLLLSQTCGYPLIASLHDEVSVVGTPCYNAPGCSGYHYRSLLVVRQDGPVQAPADLAGMARWAVNGLDSLSGYWLPLMTLQRLGVSGVWERHVTGEHRASLRAVRDGLAEFAWIDCVTYQLLKSCAATELDGTRAVSWSDPAPGLPFITSAATSSEELTGLRQALASVCAGANQGGIAPLRICGFVETGMTDYAWLRRAATAELSAIAGSGCAR